MTQPTHERRALGTLSVSTLSCDLASTLSRTRCPCRSCCPRPHARLLSPRCTLSARCAASVHTPPSCRAAGELSLAPYLLVPRRPWPPEWGRWLPPCPATSMATGVGAMASSFRADSNHLSWVSRSTVSATVAERGQRIRRVGRIQQLLVGPNLPCVALAGLLGL
ncbi:hypothetical protein BDA96_03G115900 [Sorghum bicolor]|uniref:Uncharacterized protein n=2 Tax=Sorghum bicolor TaxID=4558 RepID=A0A921RDF6_SORBI|nr:hypothetical protein SORBI_3003G111400 [Sorghum bicolor]KAG0537067.1 hypothetical protein BDA96_03G115900 [Sorghum bicolor]